MRELTWTIRPTTPSRKSRSCVISSSVPGYLAEPVFEPQHGIQIEMIGRLVEQQQVGAAHQRLREIEAHPPAAGEALHRLVVARFGEAQPGEQRRGACAGAVAADGVETMMQVGQRFAAVGRVAIGGGERGFDLRAVRDRRRARSRARGAATAGVSCATCAIVHAGGSVDRSRVGKELLADRGEEARLAAAVGADQPELVSGVDRQVGAFEQALGAPRQREIGDAHHELTQLEVVIDDQRSMVAEKRRFL